MAHQYSSSMCTSLALLASTLKLANGRPFRLQSFCLTRVISLFSLSLVYSEAQISFHALLDIATSPDSPLRLKLISIIAICLMPACSVLQWGFTFPFCSVFCLNHVSGVSFRGLYNKESGKGTFRFEQDHFWYNNPHSLTQIYQDYRAIE